MPLFSALQPRSFSSGDTLPIPIPLPTRFPEHCCFLARFNSANYSPYLLSPCGNSPLSPKSSSKEFLDTRRLVTHAFMSHKAGLRIEHLGLHKAICVLLGWDTVVPQDTVTWVPQVLPTAEALAQKEDLIIWPPVVVIHNVSMSDENPQKWKVVSMETVEAFIRGKGFVRGRIKVCLGKPADQSVILVKFLGTFVGLGDAERLNKYLSDCKRGRLEFERIKSKTGRCSVADEKEIQGDEMERILYGYMGIAEDLDKLDFTSKKRCVIKSRKEIDQLDKDPVKTSERR